MVQRISNLGANAILAVSIANIKAYSASSKQAYEVLPNYMGQLVTNSISKYFKWWSSCRQ